MVEHDAQQQPEQTKYSWMWGSLAFFGFAAIGLTTTWNAVPVSFPTAVVIAVAIVTFVAPEHFVAPKRFDSIAWIDAAQNLFAASSLTLVVYIYRHFEQGWLGWLLLVLIAYRWGEWILVRLHGEPL